MATFEESVTPEGAVNKSVSDFCGGKYINGWDNLQMAIKFYITYVI